MKNRISQVGVLLLIFVLLTGCTGARITNQDKQKINSILNQYEQAIKAKDPTKIADLLAYPYYVDEEFYLDNKEEATLLYTITFSFISEVHEFKLSDRKITISGDKAIAEVIVISKMTVLGEFSEESSLAVIELRKENNEWKISRVAE